MEVKLSPVESSPLSSSPPSSGDDGGDLVIVGGRRVGGELVDREAKVRCLLTRSRSHLHLGRCGAVRIGALGMRLIVALNITLPSLNLDILV